MEIPDILTVLSPLLGPLVAVLLSRKRNGIRWVSVTPVSMMEIADEISDRLQVKLDDTPVKNLTKFMFIVHNIGNNPIEGKDIVEPLAWKAPGRIINALVIDSDPHVALKLKLLDRTLEVHWQLFNQGCKALIEVIADAETESEIKGVSAQIRGIPKIYIKNIPHSNEESIRKNIRKHISQKPRIYRLIFSEKYFLNSARISNHVLAVYFASSVGIIVALISENSPTFSDDLYLYFGFAFGVSIYILIRIFFLRKPYAKLLRNR